MELGDPAGPGDSCPALGAEKRVGGLGEEARRGAGRAVERVR